MSCWRHAVETQPAKRKRTYFVISYDFFLLRAVGGLIITMPGTPSFKRRAQCDTGIRNMRRLGRKRLSSESQNSSSPAVGGLIITMPPRPRERLPRQEGSPM